MKLFSNSDLANALKKYKFTDNGTSAPANFSEEFEVKMGRLIRNKQRSHNIRVFSQRAAAAVVTLALVGSLFYMLVLPRNTDGIVPFSGVEEQLPDTTNEQPPDTDHDPIITDIAHEEDEFCECCRECDPVECFCYECGSDEDCECSEPENIDLSVIHSESDIEVSTVLELVSAISPDTVITLNAGLYDISAVVDFKSPYIKWQIDTYGHKEKTLVIVGVDNLTLQAAPDAEVEIVTPYRFAEVLSFQNCNDINLIDIIAGHTITGNYECDAGVLSFENCSNVFIDNCHLYGCGSFGIYMNSCNTVIVKDTIIDDCSRAAVIIFESTNIEFINSKFTDNRAYQYIIGIWNSSVSFIECEISGNNRLTYCIIDIDPFGGTSNVSFDRCIIVDNDLDPNHGYDIDDLILLSVSEHSDRSGTGSNISIKNCTVELGQFFVYWKDGMTTDLGGNVLN